MARLLPSPSVYLRPLRDMATQDHYSNTDFADSLSHSQRTAAADGSEVDLQGYESALVVFNLSAWTDGTHVFDVEHAPDDGNGSSGTFSVVSDDELLFDAGIAQINADGQLTFDAAADTGLYVIGYIGEERFLRVVTSSVTGTTTGATYGAIVERSDARHAPLNDIQRT